MNSKFRRFEILLPLRFNDGTTIPRQLVADTLLAIEERFGAVSAELQSIQGQWRHEGRTYRDDLSRIFVDVPDSPESVAFFRELKETLKIQFRQIDVWMTSHPIDVL